jgi:hypothetical protein
MLIRGQTHIIVPILHSSRIRHYNEHGTHYQIIPTGLLSVSIGDVNMNVSEQIDDIIAKLTDSRGTVFADVRRIIREADPEIIEELKWMGTPVWSRDGIVCLAKAFKDKVKVTFPHGAHLADPDKVFNAELDGKEWRAIDIHKDDQINESSLAILVRSAVKFNQSKAKTKIKAPQTRSTSPKKSAQ